MTNDAEFHGASARDGAMKKWDNRYRYERDARALRTMDERLAPVPIVGTNSPPCEHGAGAREE